MLYEHTGNICTLIRGRFFHLLSLSWERLWYFHRSEALMFLKWTCSCHEYVFTQDFIHSTGSCKFKKKLFRVQVNMSHVFIYPYTYNINSGDWQDNLLLKYLMHKHEKQSLIFNVECKNKDVMPSTCNLSTWR